MKFFFPCKDSLSISELHGFRISKQEVQRIATNTIGYTRKQANKECFDEECARVNEEKNAARERASKPEP
jgi:hypothetical protein